MSITALEYLSTERLVLRQFTDHDVSLLNDLDSDPEVMEFLTHGVPSTMELSTAMLERFLEYKEMYNGELGYYVASLKETHEFIGWFHLRPSKQELSNLKNLELGYRFKKKFWGYGYAMEGSCALLEKAFLDCHAESVFAQTMLKNKRSSNVMKKLGMTFEKEFVDPDYPGDELDVIYRIKRDDWLCR